MTSPRGPEARRTKSRARIERARRLMAEPRFRRPRVPELQLAEELVGREEAFDAVQLRAVAVDDEHGRRPVDFETLHRFRMLLHVQTDGNEIVVDERRHSRFRIHLGFQPSASPSHRCSGEVEKDGLLRSL